jgi:uncharacterized protein YgiM (DUF1202 family)
MFFFWFWGAAHARRLMIVMVSLFLSLGIGILLIVSYQTSERMVAIILNKQCDIFSGPHDKFDVVDTLDQAEEVAIMQQRSDWYKIRSSRSSGWIPANQVEVI